MARKLFIIAAGNEQLFQSLRRTLGNERDVEIFYDRRHGARAARWNGAERRTAADVAERLRTEGFAVVRPAPAEKQPGNIRWTA